MMDEESRSRSYVGSEQPSRDPFITFISRNVTLIVPIFGALVFAVRCAIVSKGDVYTAGILITQTSIGDAIRALLFSVAPIILALTSIAAAVAAGNLYRASDPQFLGLVGLGVLAGILGFLFLDVFGAQGVSRLFLLLMIALLPVVVATLQAHMTEFSRRRHSIDHEERTRQTWLVVSGIFVIAIIPALWPVLGSQNFWLPRERLVFRNETPFTGYVLRANDDRLVILEDQSRVIVQKVRDALQDRDYCYPSDHKALSSMIPADSPLCP